MGERRARLWLGKVPIDPLRFDEAIDAIDQLVASGQGGTVFTPNVDHVVVAEDNEAFAQAYAQANLSLVDGKPLLWASRLLGRPLPEKISGSDLVLPLMRRARERGWRVYLLGGGPGVAEEAAALLRREVGVNVVGTDAPLLSVTADPAVDDPVVARIRQTGPQLLLVALGAPKQELWIARCRAALAPTVAVGVGATLDFIAGRVKRAPAWMSDAGLEWLYRLTREPKRLWRRYLVNDPRFAGILLRTLRQARSAPHGP